MELEVVEQDDGPVGVRVPGSSTDGSEGVIMIPTTAELFMYTYQEDKYGQIQKLYRECLQKADENIAVARQTYDMIDSTVQRLDRDIEAMEKLLQVSFRRVAVMMQNDFMEEVCGSQPTLLCVLYPSQFNGDFQTGSQAKPDDLAACQVSPGSEWILAKVLHHDPNTGIYKLADEDVESNKSTCDLFRASSFFLNGGHSCHLFSLPVFHLPESQVVLCGVEKLSRGDMVFAVYPDTTSFYQATVVQAPRKTGGSGGGASSSARNFVMVNFVDDSDEFGITHDKAIPLQHIILPPYGAVVQ